MRPKADRSYPESRVGSTGLTIDRTAQNQDIVTRYLGEPQLRDVAFRLLMRKIYGAIRSEGESGER